MLTVTVTSYIIVFATPLNFGFLMTGVPTIRGTAACASIVKASSNPDDIVLDGWDLPFKTDTEVRGIMAGNACFNLIGEPDTIRQCIETKALRQVTDAAKAKILVSRAPRTRCDDSETELLYPDIDTHHAVVNRFKEARQSDSPLVVE